MPDERRRHVRKRVDLPATVETGGEFEDVHISDMCPGGAFIDTENVPSFGTGVKLHLHFPAGVEVVDATVRWAKPGGMGVQFGALRAKQTFAITEHLATLENMPDSRRF